MTRLADLSVAEAAATIREGRVTAVVRLLTDHRHVGVSHRRGEGFDRFINAFDVLSGNAGCGGLTLEQCLCAGEARPIALLDHAEELG